MSRKNGRLHYEGNSNVLSNGKALRTFTDEEISKDRRIVKHKTEGQADYIEAIDQSVITLCNGIAGTGKTYIAVAKATEMLLDGVVNKIVLCRPAVECEEKLGFLPGEAEEKIAPYMIPMLDVLKNYISDSDLDKYIEEGIIEFCPLAFMQGRTFHKSAMVLDEAQNATIKQLRMFLTRLGNNSRVIVSGDRTQCSLPPYHYVNGIVPFEYIMKKFDIPKYIDGIRTIYLTDKDVVRHGLIADIIAKIGE